MNVLPINLEDVEVLNWISENFDLLMALQEKSRDHESHENSSSRNPDCLYKISCQSIQQMFRYFSVGLCDITKTSYPDKSRFISR